MIAPVLRIEIGKRNFSGVFNLGGLKLSVKKYSFNVIGGPKMATIQVEGGRADLLGMFNYLRCPITVYDAADDAAWWGFIESVDVTIGAMQIGKTLKDMANKIDMVYTLQSGNMDFGAAGTQQTTGYLTDATSVSDFGTFEYRKRLGNLSACAASAKQEQELANRKRPMPVVDVNPSGAPDTYFAVITCKGWWESLDFRYYDNSSGNAAGMEVNEANVDTVNERAQYLGRGKSMVKKIWFDHLSANGEVMLSTANDLGLWYQDYIAVTSSGSNNRIYTVTSPSNYGDYVTLSPDVTDERSAASPLALVGLQQVGQKVAQAFQLQTNDPFFAKWIDVRLQSSGSVTDAVKATLLYDNSNSPTGASFNSGSVAGSALSTSLAWQTITLDNETLLGYSGAGASIYWLELSRLGTTGSNWSLYYNVGVDIGKSYTTGSLLLYTNAASGYTVRSSCQGDADMLFRVTGVQQTTDQIVKAASVAAEFIRQTIITASSNVRTSPYRDGETKLQSVVEELLETGNDASKRLIATVDINRNLIVDVEPSDGMTNYILASDGSIRNFNNTPISPHRCPYGRWARANDLGFTDSESPVVFIEEVEYDAEKNRLSKIVTRNKKNVAAVTALT